MTQFITGVHPGTGIKSIIPTSDNGLLFIGATVSRPGGTIPTLAIDTVNTNVLIGKIDSNKNLSWLRVYGGSDEDIAVSGCETADGGFAVLAETFSSNGDVSTNHGGNDFWLLKIDAVGNLIWEKTFGSTASESPYSIRGTKDGGFILAGITNGHDGDVPMHMGDFFSLDWLVIKTDNIGNVQWSRDFGGTRDEKNCSILEFNDAYYLVGSTNSTDSNCFDTAWHSGIYTSDNYHILKLSSGGDLLWDKSYGGSKADNVSDAVFDTASMSIVINGTTLSNDFFVTGYHYCVGQGDMWVIKVDTNGLLKWQKSLGSVQDEDGKGICLRHEGGYLVYGSTAHPNCTDPTYSNIGGPDCLLFAIDTAGNGLAQVIFGGTDVEMPYNISQFKKQYAACGISMSNLFSQGTTNGRYADGQEGYITYLDYWPMVVYDQPNAKTDLKISPNPATSSTTIFSVEIVSEIRISTVAGIKVYEKYLSRPNTSLIIDVQDWEPGIYIVEVKDGEGKRRVARLIKI